MNKLLASSVGIALFLLAGCAASGPKLASSTEDIVGTWQSKISLGDIQYNEDGTWRSQSGSGAVWTGEFWFEGTQFFTQFSVSCDVGNPIGIYEVELLENGNLKFTVIEDECVVRVHYLEGAVIETEFEPVP
jgi:hypothetical protein